MGLKKRQIFELDEYGEEWNYILVVQTARICLVYSVP